MTKSRNIGRGGARPGAGRKQKPVAGPTAIGKFFNVPSTAQLDEPAPIIPPGTDDEGLRQFCEALAFETLATIAATGTSEAARVAACRELLDRCRGKPSPSKPAEAEADAPDHWGNLLGAGKPVAKAAN
jgi:hypothetical protein